MTTEELIELAKRHKVSFESRPERELLSPIQIVTFRSGSESMTFKNDMRQSIFKEMLKDFIEGLEKLSKTN